MGISITLSDTVLYDPESRFIFHYLRASVGGSMELRCKFPHVPGLEPLTEMGIATLMGCNSFTLPSALSCTRRQNEVPSTDREDIRKEKTSVVFQKSYHSVISFYYFFFFFFLPRWLGQTLKIKKK